MKYPFTPEVLDGMPEGIAELYRGLELQLLDEICSRLNLAGELNEVTVESIRALRAQGISLDEIEKAIQESTNIGEKELKALLDDVVARNQEYYTDMIDLAGLTQPQTLVSAKDVDAIIRQTGKDMLNITQSMGFLVDGGRTMLEPAKAYQWAMNNAEMQIMSGAISYNQAVKSSIRQLADSGLRYVTYESGHRDHIDVAARRAVMTGINQLCSRYAEQSQDYLNTDLVEVSAHSGARNTGAGAANHASWQGKVYRWREKKRTTVLTNQGNIYFTFRDNDFLFIDTFTYQDSRAYVLAEIGDSINGFLHCKEIATAVLCHYVIIMTDIRSQRRHFLCNGIYRQSGYCTCSIHIEMRIVFTTLRHGRHFIGRHPHE